MTGRVVGRSIVVMLLSVLGAGGRAAAQATLPERAAGSAAACPVAGGVTATVTVRDSGWAAPRELFRIDRQTAVDTSFVFNVAERRWSVAELAASVAAGAADTVRRRPWYLCAGAAIGLRQPTLVIRGARGRVRLRASVRDLSTTPRTQPDAGPRQPLTKS